MKTLLSRRYALFRGLSSVCFEVRVFEAQRKVREQPHRGNKERYSQVHGCGEQVSDTRRWFGEKGGTPTDKRTTAHHDRVCWVANRR